MNPVKRANPKDKSDVHPINIWYIYYNKTEYEGEILRFRKADSYYNMQQRT